MTTTNTTTKRKEQRELIEFTIDVVQQFGYRNESKKFYYHGGLSTLEEAHGILKQHGIIKNFDYVRDSEIRRYYKL